MKTSIHVLLNLLNSVAAICVSVLSFHSNLLLILMLPLSFCSMCDSGFIAVVLEDE